MTEHDFKVEITGLIEKAINDEGEVAKAKEQLEQGQIWEAAKVAGCYYNLPGTTEDTVEKCRGVVDRIREYQGIKAVSSTSTTTVVFGTSGWRGVIGEDFTIYNVSKVVRGIIEMMQSAEFLQANGYDSFTQVQSNGIIVFRDNRFMGDEFIMVAKKELAAGKIKTYIAGECPTGVGSALVTELNAAGSINFTPSHNPMEYAGLKFNPADGGPAGPELTTIIEEKANRYMAEGIEFIPVVAVDESFAEEIDAKKIFTDFVLNKSKVFDLAALRSWLSEIKHDLAFVVDFMHGSSRGYVESILGADLVQELLAAGSLVRLHTNEDFSFHGVKPEPSAVNQAPLLDRLKKMGRKYSLAVALDPDADRIRFADSAMDIDMNRFGAIAYSSLLARGFSKGIASTAPSSDFALEIAKREGKKVYEMAVGFKNFRVPLREGKVSLAFEESDGITCIGHTLEKCALAGLLLAFESMRTSGKNISEQYDELRVKYGYFYPSKAGAEVKGVGVEEWQEYKAKVVDVLQHSLYETGDCVVIGGIEKKIASINIIDGLKLIFEDKSWILLRPSGTEPKFRYYYELASETALTAEKKMMEEYEEAAAKILSKAREMVG